MFFREEDVVISGTYPLSATLTLPKAEDDKYPIVIMIHGSGDVDRNGNAKRLPINAFKELSDTVVAAGFASLRYDKRGVGKSAGNYYETGFFDLIDDAAAAVEFAKSHPLLDPNQVILLGHSEGCLVAPAVHQRIAVQGMILLAGSAEPLSETTAWQREQLKEDLANKKGWGGWLLRLLNVAGKLDKMNDELTRRLMNSEESVITYKGKKINAKWNREHAAYDVRDVLGGVTCPVLAITGSKDVQVRPEHARKICELVQGPCEHLIIDNMTHILRKTDVEANITTILKDYKKQVKMPVDQELKETVREWLIRHFS